ncbi:DUF2000 domain-containing protein [Burkholderia sp. 22PA0106]|uniref:DUF2000 domain-containing protein n=1 Tax=Burkholderia sp. 22PA0106 TaxID=3237371 RepID=UPI0039C015E9
MTQDLSPSSATPTASAAPVSPERCVIVVDSQLPPGRAANAAAVLALTIGQRHPALVGPPLVDAGGIAHPGLIPIGIAVLAADADALPAIRDKAVAAGCDVVDFPVQGQQTTDYSAFRDAVALVDTATLRYVGVALAGARKPIGKIVANLGLLK